VKAAAETTNFNQGEKHGGVFKIMPMLVVKACIIIIFKSEDSAY